MIDKCTVNLQYILLACNINYSHTLLSITNYYYMSVSVCSSLLLLLHMIHYYMCIYSVESTVIHTCCLLLSIILLYDIMTMNKYILLHHELHQHVYVYSTHVNHC